MGVFATMILAVMTRASLWARAGAVLVVPRAIALAYLLLTAGTVLRVFGVAVFPRTIYWRCRCPGSRVGVELRHFRRGVRAPILWSPRADGKPG
jgi:uncharacterized protein involved in response to NO